METCQNTINHNQLNNVHLVGFVNQTELPTYYAAADVFVLPSQYETWGLVLNEAMASGLPGIVSDGCGAAQDMIIEGETGYSYPMGNVKKLAKIMATVADSLDKQQFMSIRAKSHVQNFSVPILLASLKKILADIE